MDKPLYRLLYSTLYHIAIASSGLSWSFLAAGKLFLEEMNILQSSTTNALLIKFMGEYQLYLCSFILATVSRRISLR